MRAWNDQGEVRFTDWLESSFVLGQANAAVLSIEDVHNDESYIEDFAAHIRILAITEGAQGRESIGMEMCAASARRR